jgi:hypothetical protein
MSAVNNSSKRELENYDGFSVQTEDRNVKARASRPKPTEKFPELNEEFAGITLDFVSLVRARELIQTTFLDFATTNFPPELARLVVDYSNFPAGINPPEGLIVYGREFFWETLGIRTPEIPETQEVLDRMHGMCPHLPDKTIASSRVIVHIPHEVLIKTVKNGRAEWEKVPLTPALALNCANARRLANGDQSLKWNFAPTHQPPETHSASFDERVACINEEVIDRPLDRTVTLILGLDALNLDVPLDTEYANSFGLTSPHTLSAAHRAIFMIASFLKKKSGLNGLNGNMVLTATRLKKNHEEFQLALAGRLLLQPRAPAGEWPALPTLYFHMIESRWSPTHDIIDPNDLQRTRTILAETIVLTEAEQQTNQPAATTAAK